LERLQRLEIWERVKRFNAFVSAVSTTLEELNYRAEYTEQEYEDEELYDIECCTRLTHLTVTGSIFYDMERNDNLADHLCDIADAVSGIPPTVTHLTIHLRWHSRFVDPIETNHVPRGRFKIPS